MRRVAALTQQSVHDATVIATPSPHLSQFLRGICFDGFAAGAAISWNWDFDPDGIMQRMMMALANRTQ
jgi:hypothetical protein